MNNNASCELLYTFDHNHNKNVLQEIAFKRAFEQLIDNKVYINLNSEWNWMKLFFHSELKKKRIKPNTILDYRLAVRQASLGYSKWSDVFKI